MKMQITKIGKTERPRVLKDYYLVKEKETIYSDLISGDIFYFKDDADKITCMRLDNNGYVDLTTGKFCWAEQHDMPVYIYHLPQLCLIEY